MARKLATVLAKGGVGKTTCSINVAGALNQLGHDVLLVDLDPQGAATEGTGLMDAYERDSPTLYDVLVNTEYQDALPKIAESHAEMDVIPSNIMMTTVEPRLTTTRRATERLSLALEHIEDEYDYIIIDSPPNMGHLVDNAMFAARELLIPALAESTSKRAIELLVKYWIMLENEYDITIEQVALIANRVEETGQAESMKAWLADAMAGTPIFEIRKRVALQYAFENGESIFEYEPENDMAERFLEIARCIETTEAAPEVAL